MTENKPPKNSPKNKPDPHHPPAQEHGTKRFLHVGIGYSAGGLAMVERFFENMPVPNGMAFVICPHQDPTTSSHLTEILTKVTKMPVELVTDGMKPEQDRVYVLPPNSSLTLSGDRFRLTPLVSREKVSSLIDQFFISLAADQGEFAAAVVLSGMGADGAKGIKAVKDAGGIILVQELGIGDYDNMPRAAMDTGLADFIVPPEKMPDNLLRYARIVRKMASPQPLLSEEEQSALAKIFAILRNSTGHDFSSYKRNTIIRRIERRLIANDIDGLPAYLQFLQKHTLEVRMLFKELLIGVTAFFRDTEAFRLLEEKVVPSILDEKTDDETIRVWVPGCSTGEEAYSMAIIFKEYMDRTHRNFKV